MYGDGSHPCHGTHCCWLLPRPFCNGVPEAHNQFSSFYPPGEGDSMPSTTQKNTNVYNEVVHFRHPAIPVCTSLQGLVCEPPLSIRKTFHRLRMGCELGSRMNQKRDHQFLHPIHIVYARHKTWTGTFCRVMQRSYNQRSRFSLFCIMTTNQKKKKATHKRHHDWAAFIRLKSVYILNRVPQFQDLTSDCLCHYGHMFFNCH